MEIALSVLYVIILIGAWRVRKENKQLKDDLSKWNTATKLADTAARMASLTGQTFDECMKQIQSARHSL